MADRKPPRLNRFRVANARRLRAETTDAEEKLWHNLHRIPLEGTHFRRQVPIGRYFADFACHRIGLIVELDGSQHGSDESLAYDALRTAYLESQGYQVIRFWNHEVLTEMEAVLDTIFAVVQQRLILLAETHDFHPATAPRAIPLPQGESEEE